jgi:hypothetical protein
MSLDRAYLTHSVAGRFRIKIPARRHDHAYFTRLQQLIAEHEQVDAVRVNSLSAGLFIEHSGLALEQLQQFARDHALFGLQQGVPPLTPVVDSAAEKLQALNRQLTTSTDQSFDLRGVAFVLLVVFGVRQLIRGNLMGPAATLFWYAFQMLMQANKDK